MQTYQDCPQVLREFLSYHETIKGQSKRTVSEYYLDIRMFLRFVKLMRNELLVNTPLEDVPIKDVDLDFVRSISSTEVLIFCRFLQTIAYRRAHITAPASAPLHARGSSPPSNPSTIISPFRPSRSRKIPSRTLSFRSSVEACRNT